MILSKQTIYQSIVLGLTVILLSGCASVFSGKTQEMSFMTEPDDVTISIDGRTIGKTPLTTYITRKNNQILTFEKEGFKPVKMDLATSTNGWFFANILGGIFIGPFFSTTDASTGAIYEYSPSQYYITLKESENPLLGKIEGAPEVRVFIIHNYDNLTENIRQGDGEYLSTLFTLLQVTDEQQEETAKTLKSMIQMYPESPVFANEVVRYYLD
ncbi:PEGA domain-containing protein [Kiritimatiellota bacterium B12222]|nr:PEGA domain-containing protein [Kiritimatiellota bacterium B12222]